MYLMNKRPNFSKQTFLVAMVSVLMSVSSYAETNVNTNNPKLMSQFMSSISDDGLAAVVNETPILKSEVKQASVRLRQMYQKSGKPLPSASKLKKQALDQLIMRKLQLNLVKRVGIAPKEKLVNARLAQYAKAQGLTSISQLQQKMDRNKKGSYAQLRQAIIDDLSIKGLQQRQVGQRVRIGKQEIDTFLASPEGKMLNKNSYQTLHVRVPYDSNNPSSNGADRQNARNVANYIQNELRLTHDNSNQNIAKIIAKAQANYPVKIQGGNMGYHPVNALPTQLAGTIVGLKVGEVRTVETNKGIDIIKLTDKKVSDDLIVPQWHTRHILIAVNEFQNEQMAELKANEIYKQLQNGADFAKLSATYSDDPGSAGKGGDLDWVSEGSMVPEFEKVMKQTNTGNFSKPFRSQYGWHILQVVNKRNYDASNDVRRGMAKEILFNREAPQAQEDWLEELKSSAYIRVF